MFDAGEPSRISILRCRFAISCECPDYWALQPNVSIPDRHTRTGHARGRLARRIRDDYPATPGHAPLASYATLLSGDVAPLCFHCMQASQKTGRALVECLRTPLVDLVAHVLGHTAR